MCGLIYVMRTMICMAPQLLIYIRLTPDSIPHQISHCQHQLIEMRGLVAMYHILFSITLTGVTGVFVIIVKMSFWRNFHFILIKNSKIFLLKTNNCFSPDLGSLFNHFNQNLRYFSVVTYFPNGFFENRMIEACGIV